jgi:hypothetical protein
MRGRTGTPQRRNDRTPSYLLLVALVFAGKLPFFYRNYASCGQFLHSLYFTDYKLLETSK